MRRLDVCLCDRSAAVHAVVEDRKMAAFWLFRPPVFRAADCRAPVVQLCVLNFFGLGTLGGGGGRGVGRRTAGAHVG